MNPLLLAVAGTLITSVIAAIAYYYRPLVTYITDAGTCKFDVTEGEWKRVKSGDKLSLCFVTLDIHNEGWRNISDFVFAFNANYKPVFSEIRYGTSVPRTKVNVHWGDRECRVECSRVSINEHLRILMAFEHFTYVEHPTGHKGSYRLAYKGATLNFYTLIPAIVTLGFIIYLLIAR